MEQRRLRRIGHTSMVALAFLMGLRTRSWGGRAQIPCTATTAMTT